ncbi:MAG: efflux RND transporter permease subunit [Myxococcales bacterium]|nr:efflux RND transporter permease subunit [Myxococcales bacterium]
MDRPVATVMVVAAVVVFGWVSLQRTPVDLMPELSYPTITVRTEYPGAAPEEVEDAISRPIEEYLGTVEGMVGMTSVSRAGSSDVVFRFAWNTPLDLAIQKVRERLSFVELPDAASSPLILRYDPTLDPILTLAIVSDSMPPDALRTFVEEEVEGELEELEGVAMVRVTGGQESVIRVALDEQRLAAYQLSVDTIVERLRAENVNVAGGLLEEGQLEYLVRTVNEFQSLDDIRETVVALRGDARVRLADVADVTAAVRDREVLTRIGPNESVLVAIYKDADSNLVATADRVRARLFGRAPPAGGDDEAADAGEDAGSVGADGSDTAAAGDGSGGDAEPATTDASADADGSGEAEPRGRALPLAEAAPAGTQFVVLTDQSTYIRSAIDEVESTAMLGGLWAIVILFVFLRSPYATFVIGLAIPLSVLATFAPLRLLGVSLNIMSLGGLALGIGMLVDNAVVVLESIVRCREDGDDPREAALRGTREVAGAVVASTLTTVAVFFPIVFVEGVAGQLFGDLALAVVLSLLASLVFALLFVPMMAVLQGRLTPAADAGGGPVESIGNIVRGLVRVSSLSAARDDLRGAAAAVAGRAPVVRWLSLGLVGVWVAARSLIWGAVELAARIVAVAGVVLATIAGAIVYVAARAVWMLLTPPLGLFEWGLRGFTAGYAALVAATLRARWVVVLLAAGAVAWTVTAYQQLGMELIPELRQGVFTAEIRLPIGTRLEQTAAALARVEARLEGVPEIDRISTFIGRNDDELDASDQGEHYAELTVVVRDPGADPAAEDRAAAAVRRAVAVEPAARVELRRPTLFSLAAPVAVEVRGERLDALAETAAQVEAAVRADPALTDVRSSARDGFPEIRVRFDRERIAALGLTTRQVADVVRAKVQGEQATELRVADRSVDIEVALARSDVSDVAALRTMVVAFEATPGAALLATGAVVPPTTARPIRLDAVADVEVGRGPAEVRHVDGQRAAVVTAGSSIVDLERATDELRARLGDVTLSEGQLLLVSGQSEEMEQARAGLSFALLLAVFLVYVVMASTFESLIGPAVILLTIPLALFGVVGVLWWTGTPVSVVALIGVIVLAGIVVNNAIVLVDTILARRRAGEAKAAAIVAACATRLRPVLITTTTTVLGLVPMAMEVGEGAEIRRPLAWVLIAGLSVSTVLTLVVIPTVYSLLTPGDRPATPRP